MLSFFVVWRTLLTSSARVIMVNMIIFTARAAEVSDYWFDFRPNIFFLFFCFFAVDNQSYGGASSDSCLPSSSPYPAESSVMSPRPSLLPLPVSKAALRTWSIFNQCAAIIVVKFILYFLIWITIYCIQFYLHPSFV